MSYSPPSSLPSLPPPLFVPRSSSTLSISSISSHSSSDYGRNETIQGPEDQLEEEEEEEYGYTSAQEILSRRSSEQSGGITSPRRYGNSGQGSGSDVMTEVRKALKSSNSPVNKNEASNYVSTNSASVGLERGKSDNAPIKRSNYSPRRSDSSPESVRKPGVLSERSQRKIDEINTSPTIPQNSSTAPASPSPASTQTSVQSSGQPPVLSPTLTSLSTTPKSSVQLIEFEFESERARRVRTLGNASGSTILEQRKEKDSLSPGGKIEFLSDQEFRTGLNHRPAIPLNFSPRVLSPLMGGSRSGNNSRKSSPILGETRAKTPDLLHRRPGSVLSGLMRERGSSTGTESIGGESMARGWTGRRREGSESGRGLRERTESLIERERRDDVFKSGLDILNQNNRSILTPPTSVRISERKRFGNSVSSTSSSLLHTPILQTGSNPILGGLERDETLKAINKLLISKGLVASEIPNSAPSRLGGTQSTFGDNNGGNMRTRRRSSSISEQGEDGIPFDSDFGGRGDNSMSYVSPNRIRPRATTSFGQYSSGSNLGGRESRLLNGRPGSSVGYGSSASNGIRSSENHHSLLYQAFDSFERQFNTAGNEMNVGLCKRMEAMVSSTTKLNSTLRNLLSTSSETGAYDSPIANSGRSSRMSSGGGISGGKVMKEVLRNSDDQIRSLTEVLIALTKEERERLALGSSSTRVSSRMGFSQSETLPMRSASRLGSATRDSRFMGRSGSLNVTSSGELGTGFEMGKKESVKSPLVDSPSYDRSLGHRRSRTSSSSMSSLSALSPVSSPTIALSTAHALSNRSPTSIQLPFPSSSDATFGMEHLSLDSLQGRGLPTASNRRRSGSLVERNLESNLDNSPLSRDTRAREERRREVDLILKRTGKVN